MISSSRLFEVASGCVSGTSLFSSRNIFNKSMNTLSSSFMSISMRNRQFNLTGPCMERASDDPAACDLNALSRYFSCCSDPSAIHFSSNSSSVTSLVTLRDSPSCDAQANRPAPTISRKTFCLYHWQIQIQVDHVEGRLVEVWMGRIDEHKFCVTLTHLLISVWRSGWSPWYFDRL